MRLFLKFEFAATFFREAASAAAASEVEAKGSTFMECERCFSLGTEMVAVGGRGGGNIWMEGVAPTKGEVPEGKIRG